MMLAREKDASDADQNERFLENTQTRTSTGYGPGRKCEERYGRVKETFGRTCDLAWKALVAALAIYGLIEFIAKMYAIGPQSQEAKWCDCGSSVTEAIARGCKYDSLASAWLPDHCRDDDLTAEFETEGPGPNGNWIYWANSNHTIEISVPEIAAMADDPEKTFHMSWDWHRVHCIYYWRKQYRAWTGEKGRIVEPSSDSEEHIMHCAEVLYKEVWGTRAGVRLGDGPE